MGGEASCSGTRLRVMVRCSLRCTGRIMIQLQFVSGSDVRVNVILRFRVIMNHG